uniref:Peptidase_M16 domain-containing protein n=1 Tax=Parastrongyloides trichosuri TaxID=131310 RepID=A0A0N4ZDZ2_PARTI
MKHQYWNISSQIKYRDTYPVSIYKSKRSGLIVAVSDIPGPIIDGRILILTEASDNAGLPHTLEHLVFMGSKKYPYKGILDIIASRCFAPATGAVTCQQYTRFTLSTVGSDGFLKILPIYIDHILRPTLTYDQYLTEVHHINGDGEDAGVVYSEAQEKEGNMNRIIFKKIKSLLYGEGHSYEVEFGGTMETIREECSIEKVIEFHKKFYHLKNMAIIVCGMIDHDKLLDVIEKSERLYLKTHCPKQFIKPFSNAKIDDIKGPNIVTIKCPSEDDLKGVVEMCFIGPDVNSIYESEALDILFCYLDSSVTSALQQDFVQLTDPYASNAKFSLSERSRLIIHVTFNNVSVDKIMEIHKRFLDKTIEEHKNPEKFNMDRMRTIISNSIEEINFSLENGGSGGVFINFYSHHLYSDFDDVNNLDDRFNDQRFIEKLLKEDSQFWADLVKKYFKNDAYICVIGLPDSNLTKESAEKEKQRIEKQKEELGNEGLQKCAENIKNAIKCNLLNKPKQEILDEFLITDQAQFYSFDVNTVSNIEGENHSSFVKTFPIPTFLHQNPSAFVSAYIIIDTKDIPMELRKYIYLFKELLFTSPAIVNGEKMSYNDINILMSKELLRKGFTSGIFSQFQTLVQFFFTVNAKNYRNIAKWTNILFNNIIFEEKCIEIAALRSANRVYGLKNILHNMGLCLLSSLLYKSESNNLLSNTLSLEEFHKNIYKNINTIGSKVIENLLSLRKALLSAPINVHIMGNEKLLEPFLEYNNSDWSFLIGCKPFKLSVDPMYPINFDNFPKHGVIGVGTSASSYVRQVLIVETEFICPEVAALLLFTKYLSQLEGPLWKNIRGKGLAYTVKVFYYIKGKSLSLILKKCSQTIKAYEETKTVILAVLDSGELWENNFEAAKRNVIYDMIERESTFRSVAGSHIEATLMNVPHDFLKILCNYVWNLTPRECFEMAAKHIRNLLDDTKIIKVFAVNNSKVEEITKMYPEVKIYKAEDFCLKI